MGYGWKGKKVRLVPVDVERHLDACMVWLNNPAVTANLLIGDFPITRVQEREALERICRASETNVQFAIETIDGRHVGMSGIHAIHRQDGTAKTGSFIGDPDDWGKGYGTDSAAIRAYYCFNILNLRMLQTSFFSGNDASRKMSEKLGFESYGVLPNARWRRGRYVDEHFLYCTRQMWEAKTGGLDPGAEE